MMYENARNIPPIQVLVILVSPRRFLRVFSPGAKLVSLSSHSVAVIPLESLEGILTLCEDALAPLEGQRERKALATGFGAAGCSECRYF